MLLSEPMSRRGPMTSGLLVKTAAPINLQISDVARVAGMSRLSWSCIVNLCSNNFEYSNFECTDVDEPTVFRHCHNFSAFLTPTSFLVFAQRQRFYEKTTLLCFRCSDNFDNALVCFD